MPINLFIVRICLLPLRNPLTIDNLPVYSRFQDAYEFAETFIKTNQLTLRHDNVFDTNNRYYMYEDFMSEQFIWIEKHTVS